MSTNHYFNSIRAKNEQNVIEDLTIEAIKIHGMDVIYLPRTIMYEKRLFGEDALSKFKDAIHIEMYLEPVNGFGGDGDILTKFGLQVKDTSSFIVSKLRFQKETKMPRPMEGDLIYLPLSKGFFEIKFVEHENPFYQLGKNYTFKLNVELFQFSEEIIQTDIITPEDKEINTIGQSLPYVEYLTVSTPSVGSMFTVGETVYSYKNGTTAGISGSDGRGKIQSINGFNITIENKQGSWLPSTDSITRYLTNESNSKYYKITNISDKVLEDSYNDNKNIETVSDSSLDFTENNPFGTY